MARLREKERQSYEVHLWIRNMNDVAVCRKISDHVTVLPKKQSHNSYASITAIHI